MIELARPDSSKVWINPNRILFMEVNDRGQTVIRFEPGGFGGASLVVKELPVEVIGRAEDWARGWAR